MKEYQAACTSRYIPPYNQDLLKEALKALGKSILIVTGVGYGIVKAMDALAADSQTDSLPGESGPEAAAKPPAQKGAEPNTPPANHSPVNMQEVTLQRLACMEERLIRMEKGLEVLTVPSERIATRAQGRDGEHFVTRAELNAAMEQFSSGVDAGIDRRFEVQNRSVQSLRTMIARTDELLEQVIESIESTGIPA